MLGCPALGSAGQSASELEALHPVASVLEDLLTVTCSSTRDRLSLAALAPALTAIAITGQTRLSGKREGVRGNDRGAPGERDAGDEVPRLASTPGWPTSPGYTTTGSAARTTSPPTGRRRIRGSMVLPMSPYCVRANRAFLARVVRLLAGELGVRQFLDFGTGSRRSTTHAVAQSVAPTAHRLRRRPPAVAVGRGDAGAERRKAVSVAGQPTRPGRSARRAPRRRTCRAARTPARSSPAGWPPPRAARRSARTPSSRPGYGCEPRHLGERAPGGAPELSQHVQALTLVATPVQPRAEPRTVVEAETGRGHGFEERSSAPRPRPRRTRPASGSSGRVARAGAVR